jgi:hypothetical protein
MVLIITTDYVISCTWVYNYAIAKKKILTPSVKSSWRKMLNNCTWALGYHQMFLKLINFIHVHVAISQRYVHVHVSNVCSADPQSMSNVVPKVNDTVQFWLEYWEPPTMCTILSYLYTTTLYQTTLCCLNINTYERWSSIDVDMHHVSVGGATFQYRVLYLLCHLVVHVSRIRITSSLHHNVPYCSFSYNLCLL